MPTVSLWLGPVPEAVAEAGAAGPAWQSDSERARLPSLATTRRHNEFVAGRWIARKLLAAVAGGDPVEWALTGHADAPPRVLRAPPGVDPMWNVAVSHSGGHVVCAVSQAGIAIDLEVPARARDVDTLAEAACSPFERRRLATLAPVDREAHFYAMWALKEATLKSIGGSVLSGMLPRIETTPHPQGLALVWQRGPQTLALLAPAGASTAWRADALELSRQAPERWRITTPPLTSP